METGRSFSSVNKRRMGFGTNCHLEKVWFNHTPAQGSVLAPSRINYFFFLAGAGAAAFLSGAAGAAAVFVAGALGFLVSFPLAANATALVRGTNATGAVVNADAEVTARRATTANFMADGAISKDMDRTRRLVWNAIDFKVWPSSQWSFFVKFDSFGRAKK
jgi:hypothetical protein